MLGYIKDANLLEDASGDLKRVFAANTTTHMLQLIQELNNIRQGGMLVADYTTKIKEICDALGSISVTEDEDEMVQIYIFGCPIELVSDQGTHFINKVIYELTNHHATVHKKNTPHYSQANVLT